jgi:tRNA pseudouridine55 synthase
MALEKITSLKELVEGRVLLIKKPLFWTSFDVVKKVRNQIAFHYRMKTGEKRKIKVGHAGTLDPLAEGLMILCTGKKTKELKTIHTEDKEYITSIELGRTTPSFDLETVFDSYVSSENEFSKEEIIRALKKFEGEISQVPPLYSAKNIKGQRAYHAARNGEDIKLAPVIINIDSIELLEYYHPIIKIKVNCSKGTYIRSLARDIGEEMRTGAHLVGLNRVRIGDYHLDNAITIQKFENILKSM